MLIFLLGHSRYELKYLEREEKKKSTCWRHCLKYFKLVHVVSWEPEGHYHYSKMFPGRNKKGAITIAIVQW